MAPRTIELETEVEKDELIRVPGLRVGDKVKIKVEVEDRPLNSRIPEKEFGGWAKGKIKILPGFDDPIEGMEEYM